MADTAVPTSSGIRTAEIIAAMSMTTDLAMGFPLEHGLRSSVIAVRLCERRHARGSHWYGLNLSHYPTGLNLTGLDLSPEMLALARARARTAGRAVSLLEADAQDLPFPNERFDSVVCTYALCSVPDDARVVSEMGRVLKPGGRLILVDHVRSTFLPLYWLQWLYEFIPRRTKGEYMTRRPAQHVMATDFEIVSHGRLRAGIVERMVAVKRASVTTPHVAETA